MTINVPVQAIDPAAYINTPQIRAQCGPFRTGAVTLNTQYGKNEYATWLYVGGTATGDITYTKWDGTQETLPDIAPGQWHRIPSIMVNAVVTIAAADLRWGS